MEIGGVERSLLSLLNNIDYKKNEIDLMLYRHQGDLLNLIPSNVNLLDEVPEYTTFRKSILEILKEKHFTIGISRILSKIIANLRSKSRKMIESGYFQMQLMWKYSIRVLPIIDKEYDVAISFLWPHYLVAEKVKAKKKIAWIHTDYSVVETDIEVDLKMWKNFDYIIAVSEECKRAFVSKYPNLKDKIIVVENINSPEFIKTMAHEPISNPMLSDSRFKIVTVARLSHAKGIDMAVEALKLIKDSGNHDVCWYVIGYGGDEEKIKKLIKLYKLEDCFILLGKKSNPYPYIKAADLYVQPSRYEGKAVTVVEAQILSKPVLITDYSTSKSQVRNQFDGYITELSNIGLARGIEFFYRNPILLEELRSNCSKTDYSNTFELDKLYKLMD